MGRWLAARPMSQPEKFEHYELLKNDDGVAGAFAAIAVVGNGCVFFLGGRGA